MIVILATMQWIAGNAAQREISSCKEWVTPIANKLFQLVRIGCAALSWKSNAKHVLNLLHQ
jgi:hypothetical protein